MFQIETAGLIIRIDNQYDDVRKQCRDYITADSREPDICVSINEDELRQEKRKITGFNASDGYAESVALYGKISDALPAYDAFVMHSSVVEVDGKAYAFAAESGIGKSTHTRYWRDVLGDRMSIINGDKPIYRFCGNRLMAFGTPWCGKEGWQTKTAAPLRALCLLERAKENDLYLIDAFEVLGELTKHFHLAGEGQVDVQKLIGLIDRMLEKVPVYRLRCRNDRSAAKTAITFFGL